MTAAVGIQKVLGGGIVGLVGSLNAALRHHGVGVTHPELGHQQHTGTVFIGFNRCTAACTAAADNQHIRLIVWARQIHA